MSRADQPGKKPTITNTTHIHGTITGPVITGTGDVNIFGEMNRTLTTKEELVAALRQFRHELEVAQQQGLSEAPLARSIAEVEGATEEAEKSKPDPTRIVKRLENAKTILASVTSVATMAGTVSDKLMPAIEHIIQSIGKLIS